MDATKTATAYALFYCVGDQLRLDQGPYPPGPCRTGRRRQPQYGGVTTTILAENVSVEPALRPFPTAPWPEWARVQFASM